MTQKEIADTLKQQPEIIELIKAYQDAKQRNPEETRAALPIVLRILNRIHPENFSNIFRV